MKRNTFPSALICLSLLTGAAALSGCGTTAQGAGSSSSTPSTTGSSGGSSSASSQIVINGPASVSVGAPETFKATVADSSTPAQWQVNGVAGGSSTTGTISSGGLYTPPAVVPATNIVTISAVAGSTSGSIAVTLVQPIPSVSSASLISKDGGKTATLTVKGANLTSASTLMVSGNAITTTQASGTLTGTITSIPSNTSQFQVAIQNPGAGAQTSTALGVVLQVQAVPKITISGAASVHLGAAQTFVAAVANGTGEAVQWQVNGVKGGSSTTGTISSAGVYTPPAAVPANNALTITALLPSSNTTASMSTTLLQPLPTVTSASLVSNDGTTDSLTVTGSNLNSNATLTVGGAAIATTQANGVLTGTFASKGATQFQIAIQNPGTGAQTSAAQTVKVQLPVSIAVSGASTVHVGTPQTYTAAVTNSTQAVQWQVNGIAGGSSTTGTISSAGIYTPPTIVPDANSVTISAVIGTTAGSTNTTILQAVPKVTSATLVSNDGGNTAVLTVAASGLSSTSVLLVSGTPVSASISQTMMMATVPASSITNAAVQVSIQNPGPGAQVSSASRVALLVQTTSARAAGRLLSQSTFGATMPLIQQVQTQGLPAFIDSQINATPTEFAALDITAPLPAYCGGNMNNCIWYTWWQHAMESPDQLRQRVAFALTDMFVVAGERADTMPTYLNALSDNSLGNWRQLMHDVTLSLAMGSYLNMFQSAKPATGALANENYAREFMQLFSMGIYQMNMDGTLAQDSSGNPIPNYTPDQVQALARAFTGWTYPVPGGGAAKNWLQAQSVSLSGFMSPYDPQHDTGSKAIVNGVVLPAGQTTTQDLDGALDAIFQHPSLPPFVCKQLIQHLVTSNPSPAYVSRVAQVFVNNGNGVRGDMSAVVRAILLDPEARLLDDPNASQPDSGHLQEPILWITTVTRGLQPTKLVADASAYQVMGYWATTMNQTLFNAPSVFGFFAPSNPLPNSTLLAPEFGLENTATTVQKLLVADWMAAPGQTQNFTFDYSPTSTLGTLLQAGPDQLLTYLDTLYLHGTMTPQMKQVIETAMAAASDPTQKVRIAVYLVITSSAFKISR